MIKPTAKKPSKKIEPTPTTSIQITANCGKDCLLEVTVATKHLKGERHVTKKLKHGERTTAKVNHTTALYVKEIAK